MMKLMILKMKRFLEAVNACEGKVLLHRQDGGKVDISSHSETQTELWEQYRQSKNCLPLVLSVPNPSDYMRIVSYYAGDC